MSDRMHPISFAKLLEWITGEYLEKRSVFQIPEYTFFRKSRNGSVQILNHKIGTAVGPAAGPHTQLAQNIIAAYLTGGRFIELKTVQKLDKLDIDKPCIDARDEGYNTEWSTELSLEQAYDEYLKGWILLHFLEELFGLGLPAGGDGNSAGGTGNAAGINPSFIFNMSIGYDLEGIKTEPMDKFINSIIDSSGAEAFSRYTDELDEFVRGSDFFEKAGFNDAKGRLSGLASSISPKITDSVTLSTMHGCPPAEIESICNYLIEEKKLFTYVKLNPTLLGYKKVREILDKNGYDYVNLSEDSFKHDLQYGDAVGIVGRLKVKAEKAGLGFGVKLSNTLGTLNPGDQLPGNEMYMSGRALFPITVELAYRLSNEFAGDLSVSYSGGASQLNVKDLFLCGIKPITFATELLKPGGYLRLKEAAELLEGEPGDLNSINVDALKETASKAADSVFYRKEWRGENSASVKGELPILDCYTAPCEEGCPINQDIPEYISLTDEAEYSKSLELIYSRNALPNITGNICEQPCTTKCTRLDYEGPVRIRDVKKIAASRGISGYNTVARKVKSARNIPRNAKANVAVLGAGPAGLSAAYFLARAGLKVSVYEKRESAGGVVNHILPKYRLPEDAVMRDISLIESLGVKFHFGVSGITPMQLKTEGFDYVFIGIGAEKSRKLKLNVKNNAEAPGVIMDALDFLKDFREDPDKLKPGKNVAVIGGGNTAMDSARSALRIPGVESVTVFYRRTEKEMPADREEYVNAVKEGAVFKFLLNPDSISAAPGTGSPDHSVKANSSDSGRAVLTLQKMKLGEKDKTGRRQPVPTNEYEEVLVDTVISAIGESIDYEVLKKWGLEFDEKETPAVKSDTLETSIQGIYMGGDAYRGPSSVVESIADGRKAADSILKSVETGFRTDEEDSIINVEEGRLELIDYAGREEAEKRVESIYERKGKLYDITKYTEGETDSDELMELEGERCLQCGFLCNKCVDVCPNRANVAIVVPGFKDYYQILHIDSLCNECGNCATFCPWEGKPYKDKLTLFHRLQDFNDSTNSGFLMDLGNAPGNAEKLIIRIKGKRASVPLENGTTINRESLHRLFGTDGNKNEIDRIALFIETVLKEHSYLMKI
ncbi:MAG: putative selenate reductase subunit YgfK [Spirochaetales bacterium]|nr:putative selenate reductase subunit YgfK [Spirochaetales bacterium]